MGGGGGGGLVTKSCPTLVTPWTVARQAPLSMGFSRQKYWSGLPFPSRVSWVVNRYFLVDSSLNFILFIYFFVDCIFLYFIHQRLYFQLLHCTHFSPITLQIVMNEIKKNTIYKKIYESEVTQSCPTLCDPMDCSLPGSSVHGIFQAIVLEGIAIPFSRGSSQPRDQTLVSCIAGRFLTI